MELGGGDGAAVEVREVVDWLAWLVVRHSWLSIIIWLMSQWLVGGFIHDLAYFQQYFWDDGF